MKETIVFVINPISGTGNRKILEAQIEKSCKEYNQEFRIVYTEYEKHMLVLVEKLVTENYKKIVVVGGDGTINEAGSILLHTDVSLGIIPQGSGNGLARHIGIPLNTQKALDKILKSKKSITIDAGKVNNHYFFSNAGIGFDASVVKCYNESSNRGFKSYFKSSLKCFLKSKAFSFKLDTDEKLYKSYMISIANGSEFGYGLKIDSMADLQDGKLDLVIGLMKNKFDLMKFGFKLLFQNKKTSKSIFKKQISKIKIHLDEEVFLQIDGELKGLITEVVVESIPKVLKIIV